MIPESSVGWKGKGNEVAREMAKTENAPPFLGLSSVEISPRYEVYEASPPGDPVSVDSRSPVDVYLVI